MKQKATDPKSELIAELLEVLKDIRRIARAASVGVTGNERRLARADAVIAKAEAKDPTICQDRPSQEGPREPHEFVTLPGLTTCVRACGQLAAASVHSGGRKPLDGMALALRIRDIEDKFYSDPGQEPCDCTPGETCAFCQGVTDAVARECDSALSSSRVAVRDEALEEAAKGVVAACSMCSGQGFVTTSSAAHGCGGDDARCVSMCPVEVQDREGCEYCGRPAAAIRSLKGKP